MLTDKSINSSISLTEELDKRNVTLSPAPGSPIERLTLLSDMVTTTGQITPMSDYNPDVNSIKLLSTNDEHAEELEAFSNDISIHVSNHLNFAKNTVKPLIEELVNNLEQRFKEITDNQKIDLEIIVHDLPEPMKEISLQEAIYKYEGILDIPITRTLNFDNVIDNNQFLELLKTGENIVDAAIDNWAIKKGDGFFDYVFRSMFDPTATPLQTLISENADNALFVYLLATKLYDNPISGFLDELATYNDKVVEMRNQAALRLIGFYGLNNLNVKSKTIIKNYSALTITVNGDVYRPWLESGGDVKALFGSTLLNNVLIHVDAINENTSMLIEKWTKYTQLKISTIRTNEYLTKKESFLFAVEKLVNSNFKTIYGHLLPEGTEPTKALNEYQEYVRLSEEFFSKIKESDMINIWDLCTNFVCNCIFYYTGSHEILENINEVCKNNPDIEIREATLLATIKYVTDFVCNQIQVNK